MEEIYNKIISVLKKYSFDKKIIEKASPEADITKDLKINSARIVDIVLDIEDIFHIEIDNKSLESIRTINDIITVIDKKVKEENINGIYWKRYNIT
ncbi:MAG: acyl carrier protein [Bacteroidota bacterium]